MTGLVQAIRGMNDILPADITAWHWIEDTLKAVFSQYGYTEIRLPILEKTELFKRSIGEVTDIVEKEMYTFLDKNNESLTLRPEGTAGCVRAAIEHGLLYHQTQKLWYAGPMYRYERPQKGRYRQFYQVGAEVFGFSGYAIEAELILLSARLWQKLNIQSKLSLQINSLGTPECRVAYREAFVRYCNSNYEKLDADSKRRLETNPLRILDTKNPEMQELLHNAPTLTDYLDSVSGEYFTKLQQLLTSQNIAFDINPRLVRGLDYYTGMVFEWVTEELGAQGTVCAGGRYDGLVKELGGQDTPAVGFAIGLERVLSLCINNNDLIPAVKPPDIYFMTSNEQAEYIACGLAERIRDVCPQSNIIFYPNYPNQVSFKSQFKRADKTGARFACIIGEDELAKNMITFKDLQNKESLQTQFAPDELITHIRSLL